MEKVSKDTVHIIMCQQIFKKFLDAQSKAYPMNWQSKSLAVESLRIHIDQTLTQPLNKELSEIYMSMKRIADSSLVYMYLMSE